MGTKIRVDRTAHGYATSFLLGLLDNWFCLELLFFQVSCSFVIVPEIQAESWGLLNLAKLYWRTRYYP